MITLPQENIIYPINIYDGKGNCIYTEYSNGKFTGREFHEDIKAIPKVKKIFFGVKNVVT